MTGKTKPADDKPTLTFEHARAWKAWLAKNHAASPGVWLRIGRKSAGVKSLAYDDAVTVALCYGWIDGQARSGDERYWHQKFTPRARRSIWSKRNREKALALIASGAMKPPGLAEIERAKKDGRWKAAYGSPRTLRVPSDLRAAIDRDAGARRAFQALDKRNRYAILFRIQTAKRAETRARRIRSFVEMLARGGRLYP